MTTFMPHPTITEDPLKELQKSTVDNLRVALGLLQAKGVGKIALYSPSTGRYCSLGALIAARTGLREYPVDNCDEDITCDWVEVSEIAETIRVSANPDWMRKHEGADYEIVYWFNDANPGGVKQIFKDTIARLSNC